MTDDGDGRRPADDPTRPRGAGDDRPDDEGRGAPAGGPGPDETAPANGPADAAPGGDGPRQEETARSTATVEWRVRRVLVALDASPASRAAAATAARLAAQLHADLAGLYVEDARLTRLTGWPGASEVGSYSAAPRALAGREMERRLRAEASRARRMFEGLAAGAAVEGRFQVVRGTVIREVLAAAGEGALLSLGRVGTGATARLGSVARAALAEGRGPLLLLPSGGRLAPPVLAVFGDGAGAGGASRATLTAAARLAHALADERTARNARPRRGGGAGARDPAGPGVPEVVVLIPARGSSAGGGAGAEGAWLRQEARSHLTRLGVAVRFHRPDPAQRRPPSGAWATRHLLAHAVASEGANALVLPADSPLSTAAELEAVVEGLDCAVLLLR